MKLSTIQSKIKQSKEKLQTAKESLREKAPKLKANAKESLNTQKQNFLKRAIKPFNDLTSLPTAIFNNTFRRYRLSDFMPYLCYDKGERIYINNDNSYGAVFLCAPRIKATDSQSIQEVLNKLEEGVFLQFMILGSKNITNFVEYWRDEHLTRARNENNELLENAVNSMAEFYFSKTETGISKSMTVRAKNFALIISLKSENKEKLLKAKENIQNILETNVFSPRELLPEGLKPYLWELFNSNHDIRNIPSYDRNAYLNRQLIMPSTSILVKDTHLEIDGKSWISLAIASMPKEFHIAEFGNRIGDTISSALNTNQFQDTFFITASVCLLPKTKANSASRNHSIIATQNWSETLFREFANVRKESIGILDRIDGQKERLFAFDLNVLISGDTYEIAKQNATNIISFWGKGGTTGIVMDEALGIHQLNFLASLPMGINEEYMFQLTGKYRSMFADQIAQFVPLESDYAGNHPNLILYSRRGQMAGIDLFVSDINFNAYLVATSGAGKSVLLNMIAFNSFARGDRVFVLDYDTSFLKLCETLDGQYVFLDPQKPISFNPFSDIKDSAQLTDDLNYLSSLIYMLGSSKHQARADEDEKLIKQKIQEFIEILFNDVGNKMEITNVRDKLKTIKDQRFQDFADQLRPFCKEGVYGEFFSGPNQFNINKEFIVTEFKGIDNDPDLRDPLIMLLIYHLNQLMYMSEGRKNRIQIVLDEAHRFLGKNPKMDDFIEQAYRRARKYNGSIILATQGFDDIYNMKSGGLSKAGSVIVNNSSWKIFMKQTEVSINMLIQSNLFNFAKSEERLLKSISTAKGQYSELLLISPEEIKIPYRLVMDRFFYYITTTDPKDKAKIKELTDSGLEVGEAIKKIIEMEEVE
ncbi:MAG: TraC family protein [Helicobacter sp.]|uniref:TraC family protein n=1 Tax=Helicobacter TaxID=209 RepID=UPI002029ED1A|nr:MULTISPECIES: TraC family protein [Helicobacter]MCL9823404.1 TraC family protein [Helicobacter colisuis]MDY4425838.1 TraC family protein [Helicobacter sp.]